LIGLSLFRKVAIVGAGMIRFHHKIHESKQSREMFVEAALDAAKSVDNGFSLKDSEALYLGYFSSDMFEKQGHTGALMADALGINPIPATRVEAACASSGAAVNQGILAIASGMYDVVLVGGVEKMRTLGTGEVTDVLAMASDVSYEAAVGFTFPGLYAALAAAHFDRYGSTWDQLADIAIKNHDNGKLNPNAQYQESILEIANKIGERKGLKFNDPMDFLRSDLNPMIADPLRLFDCCPISDGAAIVVLTSSDIAKKYTDTPIYVEGLSQASDTMALHDRAELTALQASKMASKQAYKMADIKPEDISLACVHDCFTIAEILAIEDLGFFKAGEGGKAASEGRTRIDGDIPINPDGGLKAKGHPVGATGAGMVVEIFKQLRGEADKRQVADPVYGLAHNVGATGGTVTVQIYGR
jgi:acetyl-CoA C-acetyltransferase